MPEVRQKLSCGCAVLPEDLIMHATDCKRVHLMRYEASLVGFPPTLTPLCGRDSYKVKNYVKVFGLDGKWFLSEQPRLILTCEACLEEFTKPRCS